MKKEKKLAIQQQCIEDMQNELNRIERENTFLKQLVPDANSVHETQDMQERLQKALAETVALKMQYEAAYKALKIIKQNYETEVNDLLSRLRGDVERAEATRSKFNLR